MCSVWISEQMATFSLYNINRLNFITDWRVFTARYALNPYITQIRSVFKGLMENKILNPVLHKSDT